MYQVDEFEFKQSLPRLQNVSKEHLKQLYREWLDYYDKKAAEGYDMKLELSEGMYIQEYRRIQKLENEARDVGGTVTGGRSIAEFLKRHAMYTSHKQAEAIYEGVKEKWDSLTSAQKEEIIKRSPALRELDKLSKAEIIERLRKEDHDDPGSIRAQLFKYYPGAPGYANNTSFYWSPKSP